MGWCPSSLSPPLRRGLAGGGPRSGTIVSPERPPLKRLKPPPLPIHLVHPAGRYLPAKVRAFLDLALPALRRKVGRGAP